MKKKGILITGGTSGIGWATALEFLKDKDSYVAVMARGLSQMPEPPDTERVRFIQGDVSQPTDCQRAVQEVVEWCGSIDVLVNSAGIYFERALEDLTEADFDHMLAVNLKGTTFMTKYAVEQMKQQGSGCIVNVSSDAGVHGNMLCSTYCATKGAVNLFTRAMALELAPYGIRINAVCPGDVLTPLTEKQLEQYPDREEALREMGNKTVTKI